MADKSTTSEPEQTENPVLGIDQSAGNFSYNVDYEFDAGTGLSEKTIDYILSLIHISEPTRPY